jgi:signal transduction histidine kinase
MSASDPKRTLGHMVELRFPRVPLQLHGELGLRHFCIWINSRSSRTICYQRRIGILTRYAAKLSNKASSVGATLTEYRVVDKFETSIATMTPTARQRRLTLVLAAAVLIATGIIAPFGAVQLRRIDGFIPATESAIVITDFFTAVLLFSQSRIVGSRGLLLLASGYLFSALVVLPHLLTFPGAFAPSGLLGAGLSTTAWLFIFWHLGLPISVIGYAYLIDERRALSPSAIYFSVTFVICFACLLTWIVVVHDDVLPALFVDQIGFTVWANRITSIDFGISIVALVVLWRRQKSVLDLWLIVSVCALVAELAMTTFVITSRFSLGFYTQRIFSLGASTIVLSALLAEAVVLYARLANAIVHLRREQETKIMSAQAITAAIAHEIRQPLTRITAGGGAAQRFLKMVPPELDKAQAALDGIVNAGHSTSAVIDGFRSLFGKADEEQQLVDMNELIPEVLESLNSELKDHRVSIRVDLTPKLPLVSGNKSQLQEVVSNLIINSIEAMENTSLGGRLLLIQTEIQGENIAVAVEDSGPGIDKDQLGDIFTACYDEATWNGTRISHLSNDH